MASAAKLRALAPDHAKESLGATHGKAVGAAKAPKPVADHLKRVDRATNVLEIPLDLVERDPKQPRTEFDEDALDRLAASLKAKGQLQPCRVLRDDKKGRYILIAGERRWRAAQRAKLKTLLCVVLDRRPKEADLRAEQLAENCAREDLGPIELAEALHELATSSGWNQKKLAEETGLSEAAVTRALALRKLPETVQASVRRGSLSPAAAYEISKLDDPAAQFAVAQRAIDFGWTREAVIAAVRAEKARAERLAAIPELPGIEGGAAAVPAPAFTTTYAVYNANQVLTPGVPGVPLFWVINAESIDRATGFVKGRTPAEFRARIVPWTKPLPAKAWTEDASKPGDSIRIDPMAARPAEPSPATIPAPKRSAEQEVRDLGLLPPPSYGGKAVGIFAVRDHDAVRKAEALGAKGHLATLPPPIYFLRGPDIARAQAFADRECPGGKRVLVTGWPGDPLPGKPVLDLPETSEELLGIGEPAPDRGEGLDASPIAPATRNEPDKLKWHFEEDALHGAIGDDFVTVEFSTGNPPVDPLRAAIEIVRNWLLAADKALKDHPVPRLDQGTRVLLSCPGEPWDGAKGVVDYPEWETWASRVVPVKTLMPDHGRVTVPVESIRLREDA